MLFVVPAFAAEWPGEGSTAIGADLLAYIPTFEPSGIAWHAGREHFVVVGDGGHVAEITAEGAVIEVWEPGRNLESIAIPDPGSSVIYVGGENESTIYAFDLATGEYTLDAWDISTWIYTVGMFGFEALTWVPDGAHAFGETVSGGVFYAGWQEDADIYVFAADLSQSGVIEFLGEIRTTEGHEDLSALEFSPGTGTVFALYDLADRLEELDAATGAVVATYTLPALGAWEGVAARDGCPTSPTASLTVGDDDGAIDTFPALPVACLLVDADADGVTNDQDCDDANPGVSPGAQEICDDAGTDEDCDGLVDEPDAAGAPTWFEDADGDGYGSETSTTACEAPAGHVASAEDCDDADPEDHPGAEEVPGNEDDEDCDGAELCYWDGDGDGVRPEGEPFVHSEDLACDAAGEATASAPASDCDDGDAEVQVCTEEAAACGCAAGEGSPLALLLWLSAAAAGRRAGAAAPSRPARG